MGPLENTSVICVMINFGLFVFHQIWQMSAYK